MSRKTLRVIVTDDDEMVLHVPRWGAFHKGPETFCGRQGENGVYLGYLYEVDDDWCEECAVVALDFNARVGEKREKPDPIEVSVLAWMEILDEWLGLYKELAEDGQDSEMALMFTLVCSSNLANVPNLDWSDA